jgi:hypothetical protein
MTWVDRWRSKWRRGMSLIGGRPVFDGDLVYWRGDHTFRHRGWVYAMPVPPGDPMYRAGVNATLLLLPTSGDCILVRPLALDEIHNAGVVYGLVVEREQQQ